MRSLCICIFVFYSVLGHSTILNSSLDNSLQQQIYEVVENECGAWSGELYQKSLSVEDDIIDNGLVDTYLKMQLEYRSEFDQGQWDFYEVQLNAVVYSTYDHLNARWGVFRVLDISCKLNY